MSDNIPLEIQMEIIQRIPNTKSVIRCRSVSKAWKFVIDSKEFVTAHTLRHQAHNRHLLIGKQYRYDTFPYFYKVIYVSIFDDDETFPHQKVIRNDLETNQIFGISHGLLCFYQPETSTAVIWNPMIRKTVSIPVPSVFNKRHLSAVVVFVVCPCRLDPKPVKFTYDADLGKLDYANTSAEVEVFNLSSGGTWRSPLSGNVPPESIRFGSSQVVVGGFIYWEIVYIIKAEGEFWDRKLIMSFDLTSEELTKVDLPDSLALNPHANHVSLSILRESLVVLEFKRGFYNVWMMIGHGSTRSFNQLYSIIAPRASMPLGFRKSGEPIIEVKNGTEDYELAIYEPESESITKIGFHGTFFVHPYVETLLLLGH